MSALLTQLRLAWLKARREAHTSPAAARYEAKLRRLIEQAKEQEQ